MPIICFHPFCLPAIYVFLACLFGAVKLLGLWVRAKWIAMRRLVGFRVPTIIRYSILLALLGAPLTPHAAERLYGSQGEAAVACKLVFQTAPHNNWGNCHNASARKYYVFTKYWYDWCIDKPNPPFNCTTLPDWRHSSLPPCNTTYPYQSHCHQFFWHWQHSCPTGQTKDSAGRCFCPNGAPANSDGSCPACIAQGDCSSKNAGSACPSGGTNPVNLSVGNKVQVELDYEGTGPFPLAVVRTYNSMTGRWIFFPSIQTTDNPALVRIIRASGQEFLSQATTGDLWISDPDITGTLTALRHSSGVLLGWKYTTLDGVTEEYDQGGTLLKVTDRTGISHIYAHSGTTIKVTHTNGMILTFQLDTYGRIAGFTTPGNETYSYSYSGEGKRASLTRLAYPGNSGFRTYHYENAAFPNALTGITDANGNRYATWTYDSQGRAKSSSHHNGADNITLDYTHLNDSTDPRTTVTNALGKQTTYHFTTLHDVRKVIEVEGHPSTYCAAANRHYSYDANGFVASETDWQGNTTTYTRNAKGQELARTEAAGTPQERVITTQWHAVFNLPVSIAEPGRETTYTYDAKGNELGTVVVDTTTP